MNHSPYQHQDPRQISLQQLIEEALQQDDHSLLTRLEQQWVHRFGVDSLPEGLLASEDCSPSSMEQPVAEVAPIASPESPAAPDLPEDKSEATSIVEVALPNRLMMAPAAAKTTNVAQSKHRQRLEKPK